MNEKVLMVIPVFNEANRWNENYFLDLISTAGNRVDFLFVNDGSSDETLNLIEALSKRVPTALFMSSDVNLGKAESVRKGFNYAIANEYSGVGLLDCDGAFKAIDVISIIGLFEEKCYVSRDFQAIWTSRISLAGRNIHRSKVRHFIGRIVSTIIASFAENIPWDTQSGLKIFLIDERFVNITNEKFSTRWLFEVELLQRNRKVNGSCLKVWEEPLNYWLDIKGSKVDLTQYLLISKEILLILYGNLTILFTKRKSKKNEE